VTYVDLCDRSLDQFMYDIRKLGVEVTRKDHLLTITYKGKSREGMMDSGDPRVGYVKEPELKYESVNCERSKREHAFFLLLKYIESHREDIENGVNDFGELKLFMDHYL